MHPSKSVRLFACISFVGALVLSAGSALARPEVPGQLQAAANMRCVPLCTMCHLTNPGQAGNFTKPLGVAMVAPVTAQVDIKPAYEAWAAAHPDLAKLVQNGQEPGSGEDVCGPTYGCAVRMEKEAAAPRDFTGPLWVVGAMVVGGLLRRRKHAR